ncbi:MAG TPA: AsmA-like C-terminal region-containing protein [Methyloceanibacter sp.]|nr:AsmA-like C-terminal region-containing protein [Methyloceanibacter sp.]
MKPRQIPWKWLLLGVAALAAAALALLPRQFADSSRLAAHVSKMLADWSGGEVKLTGPVRVSYFPDVAIKSGFELKNASRIPLVQSMAAEEVKISLDLPAMLLGRVQIEAVRLLRPEIVLQEAAPPATAEQTLSARIANLFGGTTIRVLRIRDGRFYVPTAAGKEPVNKFDLRLDASSGDGAITSFGSFVFRNETVKFGLDCEAPVQVDAIPIRLMVTSNPVKVKITGTASLNTGLEIDGNLIVDTPSLRGFLIWTGIPLPQGRSLQELSASGHAHWNGTTLTLDKGAFALDGATAVGVLAITPGERPRIDGTLDFERLVLDPYLGGMSDSSTAQLTLSEQAILKYLDADLRISAAEVVAAPVKLGRGGFTISAKGGLLASEVGELELCGGQASGRVVFDVQGDDAKIALNANVAGVPVDSCLQPLAPDMPLSGTGNLRVEATAEGRSYEEMVRGLGGSIKADALNGVFPLDFARLLSSAAPLEGGGWSRTAGTMFDQLDADCRLIAGQVRCDSFNMQTRRGLFSGSGSVDLAQLTLDWSLFLASNDKPLKASQLATESPPRISISGPLAEPMIRRADRPALGDGSHPALDQVSPR